MALPLTAPLATWPINTVHLMRQSVAARIASGTDQPRNIVMRVCVKTSILVAVFSVPLVMSAPLPLLEGITFSADSDPFVRNLFTQAHADTKSPSSWSPPSWSLPSFSPPSWSPPSWSQLSGSPPSWHLPSGNLPSWNPHHLESDFATLKHHPEDEGSDTETDFIRKHPYPKYRAQIGTPTTSEAERDPQPELWEYGSMDRDPLQEFPPDIEEKLHSSSYWKKKEFEADIIRDDIQYQLDHKTPPIARLLGGDEIRVIKEPAILGLPWHFEQDEDLVVRIPPPVNGKLEENYTPFVLGFIAENELKNAQFLLGLKRIMAKKQMSQALSPNPRMDSVITPGTLRTALETGKLRKWIDEDLEEVAMERLAKAKPKTASNQF